MNTATIRGAQGLSLSIDIDKAKLVASQLIKSGRVFRARLGFMLQEIELNPRIARHYALKNTHGLFVVRIEPDSPADRSQVLEGDIIISFNHKTTNSSYELFKQLSEKSILTMVDIGIIRHTEKMVFGIFPERVAA